MKYIRQEIDLYLEQLSSDRLQLVADFLAYLTDKESEEATQELLDIPEFIESFERGRKILPKVAYSICKWFVNSQSAERLIMQGFVFYISNTNAICTRYFRWLVL